MDAGVAGPAAVERARYPRTVRGVAADAAVATRGWVAVGRGGTSVSIKPSSVAMSGAMPGEGRRRPIVAWQLVNDRHMCVDGRALLGIDRAVDSAGEDDAATLLKPDEGRCPGRIVRGEVGSCDRH